MRVLVMVASFGLAQALPKVPPGGLGPLLSPPRFAVAGGLTFQASTTAHMVADGTIVLTGAAVGTAGAAVGSACDDGAPKKEGYQWHHLATDKNESSTLRGGPWTPLFEDLFALAGMSLDISENLVHLKGYQGPHPEEDHNAIYQKLRDALQGCRNTAHCREELVGALRDLGKEVCTPGSRLHLLETQGQD